MRVLAILVTLSLVCLTPPVVSADDHEDDCPGNSCDAPPENNGGAGGSGGDGGQGGDGGDGGDADANAFNIGIQKTFASGGDSESSSKVKNSGNSESSSSARGGSAFQGQQQGQIGINKQGQDNDVSTTVTITNPAEDVRGAAEEIRKGMERSAPSAPRAESSSRVVETNPCGDSTGLSVSTGPMAGGAGTITEACRVFRLNLLTDGQDGFSWGVYLAQISHFAGWFPRTVLHIASFGILN